MDSTPPRARPHRLKRESGATGGAEPGRRRFGAEAIAAVVVFVATIAQVPAVPVYDAATYWFGSVGLVHGRDVYIDGLMSL